MAQSSYGREWFYKQDGKTLGPISGLRLKELVSSGELDARQAVWRSGDRTLVFVCAATAALGEHATALGKPGSP
jgi:hypothetical protein